MVSEGLEESLNIYDQPLSSCCEKLSTGFYRDGSCNTGPSDFGTHVICAVVTDDFLNFTAARGNDLKTPHPMFRFPGLKPGDCWCLCALRWKEAYEAGVAPPVKLAATHKKALQFVTLEQLENHAAKQA